MSRNWKVDRRRVLDEEKVARIIKVLSVWDSNPDGFEFSLLFRFLLTIPLRISEALLLTKDSFTFGTKSFVRVQRLKKRGKNKVFDDLIMPPELAVKLKEYVRDIRDTEKLWPFSRFTADRRWRLVCKEAGVNLRDIHCSLHITRHTVASAVLRKTKNPVLVKDLLGHDNLDTTLGYMHVAYDEQEQALTGLWKK